MLNIHKTLILFHIFQTLTYCLMFNIYYEQSWNKYYMFPRFLLHVNSESYENYIAMEQNKVLQWQAL